VTQTLFQSLRSENPSDRWKAASLLVGAARAQNAEALAALADALEDDHPFVRWYAGLTLAQAGRSQAAARLLSALGKGPFRRQAAAADALAYVRKINPAPLLQTLSSKDAIVRQSAA
jgi:HEAT repeat protein